MFTRRHYIRIWYGEKNGPEDRTETPCHRKIHHHVALRRYMTQRFVETGSSQKNLTYHLDIRIELLWRFLRSYPSLRAEGENKEIELYVQNR